MKLKLITSNMHKFEEMENKLAPIVELSLLGQAYPEIQADTALDIARNSLTTLVPLVDGNFCIEDSGLQVDMLQGFPGPYSSYVFKTIGWSGILDLLRDAKDRKARFVSVIGLYWDKEIYTFEGRCEGSISMEGKGTSGFGFDPIFKPDLSNGTTFAEMDLSIKNQVSHRSQSTTELATFLSNLNS